jgi:hypothetical protein
MHDIVLSCDFQTETQIHNARSILCPFILEKLKLVKDIHHFPHLKRLEDHLKSWVLQTYDNTIEPSLYETICKETYEQIDWNALVKNPLQYICSHPLYQRLYEIDLCISHIKPSMIYDVLNDVPMNVDETQVIELGSGTGGFTRRMFPLLEAQIKKYVATDLFVFSDYSDLQGAKEKITTRRVNIDKAIPRDFHYQFDLILACNCIHVSKNIVQCLENLSLLVKEGGYLLLEELITDFPLTMFGLDEQIWNIPEDTREYGLWMTRHTWLQYLSQTKWKPITCMRTPYQMILLVQKTN